jgi:hypothetical protein
MTNSRHTQFTCLCYLDGAQFGCLHEDQDCVFGSGVEDIYILEHGMMLPVDAKLCRC